MKVLQVASSARRRGAEVFALQLGNHLGSRGHGVVNVSLEPPAGSGGLPFEGMSRGRFDPRSMGRLAGLARSSDVVVAHGGSTLQPVAIASALARRPFVYRNIGDPEYWGRARMASVRVGLPLRMATHVMALYADAATYMVDRYGLDPARVTVSPNAVLTAGFDEVTEEIRRNAREALGLRAEDRVFGYLGSLSEEKRPEWALEVVRSIQDSVLVVAGNGPLAVRLSASADLLGDRGGARACRMLGAIDDPARLLQAIDVLLLPSRTEGIPGVMLEAALVGTPTVATAVGGVPEVTAAIGGAGCVAAHDLPGFVDAARSALEEPTSHRPDRAAVEAEFSLENVGDTWEAVLSEVCESGR